jgi:hypothetical protein
VVNHQGLINLSLLEDQRHTELRMRNIQSFGQFSRIGIPVVFHATQNTVAEKCKRWEGMDSDHLFAKASSTRSNCAMDRFRDKHVFDRGEAIEQ